MDRPVILVTGASSGIGAATARLFGREGYRVVLAARRQERLEALAEEIRSAGGQALAVVSDCGVLDEVQNLVAQAISAYGQVDVLFNNAGFGRLDWLENLDPVEDIQGQIDVNLSGVIQMARAVLPHMIERRSGWIINMASVASYVGTPTYSIYAATKFGVRGFTEALRREVGVYGIRVSAIYPGGVKTEFSQHARIQRKTGSTTPDSLRLSSEQVAAAVLNLVRRPRRGLILPWPMRLAIWTNILFPALVDWAIERSFTRKEREL
jgi:short-subunit dehydrogenase